MTDATRTRELDGLRALAVLAVIVEHAFGIRWAQTRFEAWSPGSVGVRLFFVLSGFLITGILLKGRRDAERAGLSKRSVWTAFYLRRSLRIFPLAYAAILIAVLAGAPAIREHLWSYLTYTENVLFARQYSFEAPLSHFWSLAVEEQFYLAWPILILLIPEAWLLPLMLASVAGAMLTRGVLLHREVWLGAYVLTPARLDALAVGGVCALVAQRGRAPNWRLLAWGGAGLLLLVTPLTVGTLTSLLSETAWILLSAAIVVAAAFRPGWGSRFLGSGPLVWVGTISYGVYVYHLLIPGIVPSAPEGWPLFCWMLGTTLPVAAISWYGFERPINSLKSYFPYTQARRVPDVSVVLREENLPT